MARANKHDDNSVRDERVVTSEWYTRAFGVRAGGTLVMDFVFLVCVVFFSAHVATPDGPQRGTEERYRKIVDQAGRVSLWHGGEVSGKC